MARHAPRSRSPLSYIVWTALVCLLGVALPLSWYVLQQLRPAPVQDLQVTQQDLIPEEAREEKRRRMVDLYFLLRNDANLGRERQELLTHEGSVERIEAALSALWLGPESGELTAVIPESVRHLAVFIDPDLRRAYVDLSTELRTLRLSVLAEWAMIYSIVNTTVHAVDGVDSVQLLCEGEPVRDWTGAWDILRPLYPEVTLVDHGTRGVASE